MTTTSTPAAALEHALRHASRLDAKGLVSALSAGLCARCVLRFAQVDDLALYSPPSTDIRDVMQAVIVSSGEEMPSSSADAICSCCLSVLSDRFHENVRTQALQVAETARYDVDSFTLNIKLPSAVLLREYSLRHHLAALAPRLSPSTMPVDLKDVLKHLVTDRVAGAMGIATCAAKSDLAVLLEVTHPETVDEVRQIPAIREQLETRGKKRHRGPPVILDGFGAVTRALSAMATPVPSVQTPPSSSLTTLPTCQVSLEREPVYLQGRYLKYKRGLSQTPWVLDGERLGDSSVEECIGDVALPFFHASRYKFHTAGREDVDVRMLGNGRPFILELLDAKKGTLSSDELAALQDAVNRKNDGIVEIREVRPSTKEYFANLQAGADSKRKTYCCVVWSARELTPDAIAPIDAIQDLVIQQKTPVRVLHRRTLLTRPKVIHAARCEVLNAHYMLLRLTTSAGTYVKEFVHGDRGRTVPNVASLLGADADILQLDVESLIDA
ncbi:hypothetical protein ATCC90586_008934 [Pythium insidiosum]|nr:hypothetical protein ATCC90586_008934 [Pythium insidiosum]